MTNFTTRDTFLIPSFDLDVKEEEKLYRFLLLLENSGVSKFFPNKDGYARKGRLHYSYYDMFATILYGFAFDSPTLRDLEESCKYDLRYFYLMQQKRPKHTSFKDYMNNVVCLFLHTHLY